MPLFDSGRAGSAAASSSSADADLSGAIRTLGDLAKFFRLDPKLDSQVQLASMPVLKAERIALEPASTDGSASGDAGQKQQKQQQQQQTQLVRLVLRLPVLQDVEEDRAVVEDRLRRLAQVFDKSLLETIMFDPERSGQPKDWTPPNGTWKDGGRFFNEAAEFFDPIQGNVADCYFIAALSAVAWSTPKKIVNMTRATGQSQSQFVNIITFYKPDNGGVDADIEVTDTVPMTSSGQFIYCRSSEAGEAWPAIYEKAYAKLKTKTLGDHPDITTLAWGDCVLATAQLTGGKRFYYGTSDRTGEQLWTLVRANSLSYRTFNPMTAWTYSSGDATERKIIYSDANIVASHCYTVLGWAYQNERRYIVLRNPWGSTEATINTLASTIVMYDISWWRPINLTAEDGVFAIEADTFKRFFAGLGVVKP